MATQRRRATPAEDAWAQRVHTEHVSPTVIGGFVRLGTTGPGGEHTRSHIEECDECARVFTALKSKNGDDVVLDYVHETREALRQMWAVAEKQGVELQEQFAAIRRTQMWTLIGLLVMVVLRLWPSLLR